MKYLRNINYDYVVPIVLNSLVEIPQVVLLEQQLSDKTLSSQSHVEELTRMRTELAQERASIAIFKQEVVTLK